MSDPLPALEKAIDALRGVVAIRVDPVVLSLSEARALLAEIDRRSAGSGVREALPFVEAFTKARERYAQRYQDKAIGYANFDRMPDDWPMKQLTFTMGQFRALERALRGPGGAGE